MRQYRISGLFFILLFTALPVLFAQTEQKNILITLKAKNISLGEALTRISEQAQIPVAYSNDRIPVNTKVSIHVRKQTLEVTLETLLTPLNLDFVIIEHQIIIKQKTEKKTQTEQAQTAKKKHTISGYVKDTKTGETLPGVSVYISDNSAGTMTNGYGFFSLTLPENTYQICFTSIGYQKQVRTLTLSSDQHFDIHLDEDKISLPAVEITSKEDSNYRITVNKTGTDKISARQITSMPMFFSEADVIKSLSFLPGVKNTIDGSSSYYVRGGDRDQNLIILDDAPVYNPSHLFGFFTCINPYALTDINFYKSDFPVNLGGKLSSVLELRTKEGNNSKTIVSGELGLITARVSLEGPIKKNRSSYFVSYRTSHVKRLLTAIAPNVTDFRFDDFNAKFNFFLNKNNRLLFSFYSGNDKFFKKNGLTDKDGISWGNFLSSVRWNHVWNKKLFSNLIIYASNYNYNLYTCVIHNTRWNSGIGTSGAKFEFSWFSSPQTTRYFGLQYGLSSFRPGILRSDLDLSGTKYKVISPLNSNDITIYFSENRKIQNKLQIKYGLRIPVFHNIGPATWYAYNASLFPIDTFKVENNVVYNSYLRIDPSLTLSYQLTGNKSIKFNYVLSHQFQQVLSNSVSPFTTLELWYPSTPNILPQAAHQFSSVYVQNISENTVTFSVEIFYKILLHQFDFINQPQLLLNQHIESQLLFGKGYSYGTEITLRKSYGKLTGWLGFSFSRAYRIIEGINSGLAFPAISDKPYDFSVYMQYNKSERTTYTLGIMYVAGNPFTSPTGYFTYQGYKVPVYDKKNNSRMPDYFRTDVSWTYRLNKKKGSFSHFLTLGVFNVLNYQNPAFLNFNKITDEDGKFIVPYNLATDYTLTPTKIVISGFVPGIRYNFSL